tara:strand:- start:1044 stop:1193 length:150 start_codon:yes stop_codon:yes gene_type:complete
MADEGGAPKKKVQLTFAGKNEYIIYSIIKYEDLNASLTFMINKVIMLYV